MAGPKEVNGKRENGSQEQVHTERLKQKIIALVQDAPERDLKIIFQFVQALLR